MQDRELLEKAANAAGIEFGLKRSTPLTPALYIGPSGGWWNPLADDGDALRLAVRLGLDFYEGDDDGRAAYVGYYESTGNTRRQRFAVERHDAHPDAFAATRRAIVRAAAECSMTHNADVRRPQQPEETHD